VLLAVGVLLYVAAKIDFFRHYGQPGYLREHSAYWLAMCALGVVLLAVERLASANSRQSGTD
jgi:hypothetical protein